MLTWIYLRIAGRPGIVVLCYHGVTRQQRASFEWQMRRVAGLSPSRAGGSTSVRELKPPAVQITFDDAFANLIDNAVPVLTNLDIPAIVFVVSGSLGRSPTWAMPEDHPEQSERVMSANQVADLAANPAIRIGSHTVSHPRLDTLEPALLQHELAESKRALEELMGKPVLDLALPYGAGDERVISAAQQSGYRNVFTLDEVTAPAGQSDGVFGRFLMSRDVWRIEFLLTIAGAYGWLGPWRRFVRRVRTLLRTTPPREPTTA